jgi:pimeloyl-ACP methyl ester carboxylesterase
MAGQEWTRETVRVGGNDITCVKGGSGKPLLVLHEEIGHPGWLRWHSELARSRTVLIPLHPGFGTSPSVPWVVNIGNLARFYSRMIQDTGFGPVDVIGFSLGGWIAAEMAINNAAQFRRLILVAPVGIKPPEGDIMDMFLVTAQAYVEASVYDRARTPEVATLYGGATTPEQFEAWEDTRAETARLAWQPYLYNPHLGPMLEGIKGLPTLVIWGKEDRIVPVSAADVYHKAIAGSTLLVFEGCGHRPEIERAEEFIARVQSFLLEGR